MFAGKALNRTVKITRDFFSLPDAKSTLSTTQTISTTLSPELAARIKEFKPSLIIVNLSSKNPSRGYCKALLSTSGLQAELGGLPEYLQV